MEQLTHILINYWPHLLGLAFLALIAINFRSWLAGRKSEADSAK
jgi:hypothetical protein